LTIAIYICAGGKPDVKGGKANIGDLISAFAPISSAITPKADVFGGCHLRLLLAYFGHQWFLPFGEPLAIGR